MCKNEAVVGYSERHLVSLRKITESYGQDKWQLYCSPEARQYALFLYSPVTFLC
jgi:hypothetical protein